MFPAINGRAQCVELLLGKDAAVDQPNKDGYTSLHLAVKKGHAQCEKLLREKGAR